MSKDLEILLVTPDLSKSDQLKHILEKHDYRVSVEPDESLALTYTRHNKPPIVISSTTPSETDGYKLCRAIKADENLKDSAVILLTSLSDVSEIIRYLESRADSFVPEPCTEELLMSRIRYILTNRELRKSSDTRSGVEIAFGGEKYSIRAEPPQLVDLLISAYETAVRKNLGLLQAQEELKRLGEDFEERVEERTAVLTEELAELRRSEEQLIQREKNFQGAQKMEAIGTLTGGVAHDFNNLLMVILGCAQLAIRKLKPDDPLQLRLTEIETAGKRAAGLTRQLLAFSRRQHLERRAINLNDIIGETMKLLERIIGADVEVSVKYCPDLSTVFADPAQIEQVVMNLAVNARDAMPEGGRLTIETANVELDKSYCLQYPYVQPGKYVQIKVSDSGTGMSEEIQAHIFEPYFTTKEFGKGTGLGLSMAYGIIKQHDGHINVFSELGAGTTFEAFLPVIEQAVEEKTLAATQSTFSGGTEMILIAEDEDALRNLTKDILESLGYAVLSAKNGEEAVKIFTKNRDRIDMLLFDVVMPRLSGTKAYEKIRSLAGKDIPIILMTGYSLETVQSRFVKHNPLIESLGIAVIQKPYSADDLGRKVREVLDNAD